MAGMADRARAGRGRAAAPFGLLAMALALAGCASGDFGRTRADMRSDDMHRWVGEEATASVGIASSQFQLTDDERLLRDYAYPLIEPPHSRPEWKGVFALLGRPSKIRPKNASLDDFERLYVNVDDYGWYQGMFEMRTQEMMAQTGVKFLRDLKRKFPQTSSAARYENPPASRLKPAELLEQLEKIAPGFQRWAEGFRSAQ